MEACCLDIGSGLQALHNLVKADQVWKEFNNLCKKLVVTVIIMYYIDSLYGLLNSYMYTPFSTQ